MLNKIISFSIRNKLIIGLFVIGLIGYGIFQTTKLPIDAVPDITDNQVQVITSAPSFGATDIERLITFPIEQANSNIDGLKEIRSFSRFGLSLVTIVFEDDVEILKARQQVAERLQQIQSQIPAGIGVPQLGPITTGLGEIYQYVIRAKEGYENKYDITELRTIQDWIVRRQLLGVQGVAEVSSFGGKLKQFEISVNSNKLQAHHIGINDVFDALEKNNQNTGGSYIEKGPTVLFIRSEGLIGSIQDIENISIKHTENGTPLFIKDVAEIKIGYATRFGAMCYNDKGEVAGAVVMMIKGANSNQVIENVKERIHKIQKTLPEGVILEPFIDRTKMVNNAIHTVEKNLLEGALIVVFILVLFLGNFRAGLLVASVIPLSMLFAIIMMNMFGVSGNLMSLGALDFGLIVDGAVIIVEAVMHQLHHKRKWQNKSILSPVEMDEQVRKSAGNMMNSAVFGQIIILIVYLPIFTLQGIEGKMFKPMAQTVAFALLGAFILSVTYIPMMSSLILSKKLKTHDNFSDKIMIWIEEKYQFLLKKVIQFPKILVSSVMLLFLISLFTLSNLGGEFIPALEEGDFAVDTRVLTGSNLNTTIEGTQKAAHILLSKFPEVEKVVTKIGSGEVPTDPMPIEASDMMVILKDKKTWTSAKTFPELAEKMGDSLSGIAGITYGFQYPVQMRFNELMTGAKQDVVCKIFGENLDTLTFYAEKLGALIRNIEGAKDLYIETVSGVPQIIINYNRAALAQYNLDINFINKIVNTAFAGQTAGMVFEGEKRFDLIVKMDAAERKNLEDVKNLLIPTTKGAHIPLYQIADVRIVDGPNQIQREDAKRRIVVGFNVRERDVQSIVNELQSKSLKNIKLPTGYFITYGGAFENLTAAKKRLLIAVPVSLILIFILLFFAFNSIKHGLLIYSAIPLSAIGGIFFLAIRDMPFSISAGVGFIALFGVAVLNGIVLIAEFNLLKKSGETDLKNIVIKGTKVRLRPVLMTAFVASLGFLPMALSQGAGAEVQRPLATVVIGGLLIATLLTLFVLPVLYIIFESTTKIKINSKLNILLLFLIHPFISSAQNSIEYTSAIDSAINNNLLIKNETLKTEYQKLISKSYLEIPQTSLSFETGNMNSNYSDKRIGISQSLSFPTVYTSHKNVLNEELNTSIIQKEVQEYELKKVLTQLFYKILIRKEKEKLLLSADSVFNIWIAKFNLQFNKGEINILDKSIAENQRGNIQWQLKALQSEINIMQLKFQLLLNTKIQYLPTGNYLLSEVTVDRQADFSKHPIIKLYEQQKNTAIARTKWEKSKLLPEINMSYNSMSMKGIGADNILYNSALRFNSAQIGLGIPLFFGSQKSKINASKIEQQISQNTLSFQKQVIENEMNEKIQKYENYLDQLNYFKSIAIPNAKRLKDAADNQLHAGQINFTEWVMLYHQSIITYQNYFDSIEGFNESCIDINYLTSKNK